MKRVASVVGACLTLAFLAFGCANTTQTRREPSLSSGRNEVSGSEVMRGLASYYSDKLAGRHTANGERYQPSAMTAAHLKLPFGTLVRVTRDDTGQTVIVRINDRGPYGGRGRILDLSKAAAKKLDMLQVGVVSVSAQIVGKR